LSTAGRPLIFWKKQQGPGYRGSDHRGVVSHGGQPKQGTVCVVCMKPTLHPPGDLGEVFRLHRAGLVRLAAFIVGDRGTGEDVVQDVFVRVHQRGQPVDGDLLPYLRAAVVNSCRNAVRRRLLIRRHAEKHAPCPPLSAEEAAMLSEDRRQVLAALAALPPRRREVLVLRFYLELSEAETAAMLGISPGTVKSTTARGLAALARALKETS
jgi:RNA polymerase sigma-70 factor (sigma-E family)